MIKTPASVLDLLSLSMKRKRFVRIFCIWKSESLLLGDKNSYCTTFVSSTFSLVKHHVTLIRLLFNNTFSVVSRENICPLQMNSEPNILKRSMHLKWKENILHRNIVLVG